jgi:hypothetical protein
MFGHCPHVWWLALVYWTVQWWPAISVAHRHVPLVKTRLLQFQWCDTRFSNNLSLEIIYSKFGIVVGQHNNCWLSCSACMQPMNYSSVSERCNLNFIWAVIIFHWIFKIVAYTYLAGRQISTECLLSTWYRCMLISTRWFRQLTSDSQLLPCHLRE